MSGARRANVDGLIENLVAVALYRSAAESIALADPLPGGIGYWRSSDIREIDFLVPPTLQAPGTSFAVPLGVFLAALGDRPQRTAGSL